MNSSSDIKRKSRLLARRYQAALRRYLQKGPAASVRPALQLGRQAMTLGLETLDLAMIHEQALVAHAPLMGSPSARDRAIKRAGTFFAEAITPMEKTHRTALKDKSRLNLLNRSLTRSALNLAASNRRLKKEISRRRVVEETLRKSEQHTSLLLGQSQRLQEQMRLLSRRVLSAQEEERKRVSRELHDVIAQMLTSINVRLATLKTASAVNTKGLSLKISRAQRMVERSVNIVHKFARELRPAVLDDLGLIPALHSFMKRFIRETGIRASLTASAGLEELSSVRRTALYRVAQEALSNVARHSGAGRVEVSIQRLPDAVHMQIKDDGKSFDVERMSHAGKSRHLGLLGMRERVEMVGGSFHIESSPGKGTAVQAQIPFKNGVKERTRP